MSILNITNLTNTPERDIRERFLNAFEELEKELDITIGQDGKENIIDMELDNLEDKANNTMGVDLLGLIDNYIVNSDYYAIVKEWYNNQ